MPPGPTLYFLGGVTASGKSGLALGWAEENNAEILSCDSIAIYRGMDLGSAKPTREEREFVAHHGLDLAVVSDGYGVPAMWNMPGPSSSKSTLEGVHFWW